MIRVNLAKKGNKTKEQRIVLCNRSTDTILNAPRDKALSFEEAYATMYRCQIDGDDHVLAAVAHFDARFCAGQWRTRRNWELLHDCWLYPLRTSKHAGEIRRKMQWISWCIGEYTHLLHLICIKYRVPKGVQQLIRCEFE